MNLIRRVSAIYKEQELPEYRGNPLIEALPEAGDAANLLI